MDSIVNRAYLPGDSFVDNWEMLRKRLVEHSNIDMPANHNAFGMRSTAKERYYLDLLMECKRYICLVMDGNHWEEIDADPERIMRLDNRLHQFFPEGVERKTAHVTIEGYGELKDEPVVDIPVEIGQQEQVPPYAPQPIDQIEVMQMVRRSANEWSEEFNANGGITLKGTWKWLR